MNMRRGILLGATLIFLVAQALASPIVLTFEGLQDFEPIADFYNGGLGGFGSGPGPSSGITFGPDSLALISVAAGGSGDFAGQPSGITIAFFQGFPGDVMDVPAGFTTGFSFFYSAVANPGTITVWSGLDGTGTQLASLFLPITPSGVGGPECTIYDFCPWFPIGVPFSGTAESVIFSGAPNVGFDNLTAGSPTPVPEPSTITLLGAGIACMGALLRKPKVAGWLGTVVRTRKSWR
jgi:hypothetical protein